MWAAGTVLALAFTLSGCGGNDNNKNAGGASPGPSIPQVVTPGPTALTADQLPDEVKSAAAAAGAKADASGAKASKDAGALITQNSQYADFASGDWFLSEAVKPTDRALRQARQVEASLDWTATYEEPNTEQAMTLTGHLRGLAAEKTVLEAVVKAAKAKVIDGTIGGKKAVWADVSGGNVIMLIALTDTYTLEVETTGVDLNASLDLAKLIKPTTEAKWKAAGGIIGDCSPGDDCATVKS